MSERAAEHPVVVFDGVCNFCNGSVQFILARDRKRRFRFAALQSQAGRALLERYGFDPRDADTFVLVDRGRSFVRSDAVIEVARGLPWPWSWGLVLRVLPRAVRDAGYRVLAKNRYQWFGKRDTCMVPTADVRDRFLA